MIDPVDVQSIALAALLAGAIIFFGTAYGVFLALAHLRGNSTLLLWGYAFYLGLVASTLGIAAVLHLSGWWVLLVVTLLIGYLIAPHFIWRLSVAVHELDDVEADELAESTASASWRKNYD